MPTLTMHVVEVSDKGQIARLIKRLGTAYGAKWRGFRVNLQRLRRGLPRKVRSNWVAGLFYVANATIQVTAIAKLDVPVRYIAEVLFATSERFAQVSRTVIGDDAPVMYAIAPRGGRDHALVWDAEACRLTALDIAVLVQTFAETGALPTGFVLVPMAESVEGVAERWTPEAIARATAQTAAREGVASWKSAAPIPRSAPETDEPTESRREAHLRMLRNHPQLRLTMHFDGQECLHPFECLKNH